MNENQTKWDKMKPLQVKQRKKLNFPIERFPKSIGDYVLAVAKQHKLIQIWHRL